MNNLNLVFDIGANNGEYTQMILRRSQNAKVICVDPNTNLCNKLKDMFSNNNVVVYNKAVNNSLDEIDFFECLEDDGVSTVSKLYLEKSCFTNSEKVMSDGRTFKDHYHFKLPIKVGSILLDDLVKEHGKPDLIKIDVEGHELEVIKSLTQKVPKITFEWHEEFIDRVIQSVTYLSELGFTNFGTEIWHTSADYHDNEINENEYYNTDTFIDLFKSNLKEITSNQEKSYITRSGMVWAK